MGKITIVNYPPRDAWEELLRRPEGRGENLEKVCEAIFEEVRREGDAAALKYTWHFDRVRLDRLDVTEEEFEVADQAVSPALKEAILLAKGNIEAFHALQRPARRACEREDAHGFRCWQEARPIERVGLYVPGGSAPLFSTVLMLAVPARLAGCAEIGLCTPPGRDGKVHPAILWSARACGVTRVFKLGGVQAIAAMTFGTGSVGRVDKIFGPGNPFVTAAKQRASTLGVAIDLPAGPSELMVVADETADPRFVAADLLSQAEHGPDSQVFLVTREEELPARVEAEVERQLRALPRREVAEQALAASTCVVLRTREECVEMINRYAPEHLMLSVSDPAAWVPLVRHAGSVFLGHYSPESAGDYASGTNHTLPTGGYARACSGVSVESFMKRISFQEISPRGLAYLAPAIEVMAENEGLIAHRNAVRARVNRSLTEE
ncbi:MAG: histidinol dehydrogenase [Odoribacteraceae bacterium]|jgi:histidinol dehydrogenase|nr:histidinol dehydrogenase [Odoribacteraceae bacterium]